MLELNLMADKNFAFEFYGQKGKTILAQLLNEWKESNDAKQW